jgi:hypothetical protein
MWILTSDVGAVSGPNGCLVKLQDAVKKTWPDVSPIPELASAAAAAEPLRDAATAAA